MLAAAIVLVVAALVLYSIGVWHAKAARTLKRWHIPVFWAGFACDFTGTALMASLRGGPSLSLHGLTGYAAIVLMAATAVAATAVWRGRDERRRSVFPNLAAIVWAIWLVSFLTGMFLNMKPQ